MWCANISFAVGRIKQEIENEERKISPLLCASNNAWRLVLLVTDFKSRAEQLAQVNHEK